MKIKLKIKWRIIMRTETHGKKLFVLAIAFVMIVSQLVTAIPASAATVLPIAQYVRSE